MRKYILSCVRIVVLLLILMSSVVESDAQSLGGIGAVLKLDTTKDGYTLPRIQSLVANSPAAKTLKEGLYIIAVNGLPCKDQTLEQVVLNIRGAAGTKVTLSLADNPKGKQAKDYELERVVIQQVDPVDAFNAECEAAVKQLKRQDHSIERTLGSECGDYFFNFDAEPGTYHVRLMVLTNGKPTNAPIIAKVSGWDGNKEIQLKSSGNNVYEELVTFKKSGVGVVATMQTDKLGCKAIYLIVYK